MNELKPEFGIASLMEQQGEILYCHLFSSKNIGRVVDLIIAKIREIPIEEFRVRTVLDFQLSEAFQEMTKDSSQPVLLEIGVDDKSLFLSVSYCGSAKEIRDFSPIFHFCKRVIYKKEENGNKKEIQAVLSFTKSENSPATLLESVDVLSHELEKNEGILYTELGDLDYSKLLSESPLGENQTASIGELIAIAGQIEGQESLKKIKGVTDHLGENSSEAQKVSGENDENVFSFKGFLRKINPFRENKKNDPIPEEKESTTVDEALTLAREDRIHKILFEYEKNSTTDHSKERTQRMLAELKVEKMRLMAMIQDLTAAAQRKGIRNFREESRLRSELRVKDDLIQQKNTALNRVREQLAQSQLKKEDPSYPDKNKDRSHAQVVQNQEQTEQVISIMKSENTELIRKNEELQRALSVAEQARVVQNMTSAVPRSDYSTLQAKMERTQKQLNEFKKMNQQLVERLSVLDRKDGADPSQLSDIKAKLGQATKVASDRKNEVEQLQLKLDEAAHENQALKRELAQVRDQQSQNTAASVSKKSVA